MMVIRKADGKTTFHAWTPLPRGLIARQEAEDRASNDPLSAYVYLAYVWRGDNVARQARAIERLVRLAHQHRREVRAWAFPDGEALIVCVQEPETGPDAGTDIYRAMTREFGASAWDDLEAASWLEYLNYGTPIPPGCEARLDEAKRTLAFVGDTAQVIVDYS